MAEATPRPWTYKVDHCDCCAVEVTDAADDFVMVLHVSEDLDVDTIANDVLSAVNAHAKLVEACTSSVTLGHKALAAAGEAP